MGSGVGVGSGVGLGAGVSSGVGTISVGITVGLGMDVGVTVGVGSWLSVSLSPPPPATAMPTIRTMNAVTPSIGPFHHHDSAQNRRQPSLYLCITGHPLTVFCEPILGLRLGGCQRAMGRTKSRL